MAAHAPSRPARWVALAVLGLGGALTSLGAAQPWARLAADDGLTVLSVQVTGSALAPLAPAAGLVGLAAVLAVLAVRTTTRRVVAVVVAVLATAAVAQAVAAWADLAERARRWWAVEVGDLADTAQVALTAWPAVTIGGLVLVAVGAGVVLLRGADWSGLSSRYERPGTPPAAGASGSGAAPPTSAGDLWQALDRGDDPTDSEHPTRDGGSET